MIQLRNMSPSASYWFNKSRQTCIRHSFCSGTQLVQTLWYFNAAPWFPMYWNQSSPLYKVFWTEFTKLCRWVDWDALHFVMWQLRSTAQSMADLSHCCHHCWTTTPTPHCAHIHRLVSINTQQTSVKVNRCHFFCMRNSVLHLYFLCISMSDPCQTPLLPPVSQPQKYNRMLVERFSLYCYTTNISLWHCGPT